MTKFVSLCATAGVVAFAATAGAQGFAPRQAPRNVPTEMIPPPGMCRIWIAGVPANQQPAPTDCATAVRNKPANGRVIFGDDFAHPAERPPKKTDSAKVRRPSGPKPPPPPAFLPGRRPPGRALF